ncbi:MAG: hypothetical protein LBU44_04785 [Mediterranea sp.]|jgi:hypothetical protein|nr:hypothetical protein [Mediterranea sp.]
MKKWKHLLYAAMIILAASCNETRSEKINRSALVGRNNPEVTAFEPLSSLSVGNGNFAFTVDATGLQSYPGIYAGGIPLGTQSNWGWHSFPNKEEYKLQETLGKYNFRGWDEPYAVQFDRPGRQRDAANYLRANPHRLHLGYVGFDLSDGQGKPLPADRITQVRQKLNLWEGVIDSRFNIGADPVCVQTAVHPTKDQLAVRIQSGLIGHESMRLSLKFPYPTGNHTDDATDRSSGEKHKTDVAYRDSFTLVLKRTLDQTVYYVAFQSPEPFAFSECAPHDFLIYPRTSKSFEFTCTFSENHPSQTASVDEAFAAASAYRQEFWQQGGAIDFSKCTDKRARELERRVILSQYLTAIQCSGVYPPQETGLTYNSWYGKFHLEMHWWHAAHFALWDRGHLLERSLEWYDRAYPVAKDIAGRQGFAGVRWMKMTDPSGGEAPSKVGSFLIWQQPHPIYLAELLYRNRPDHKIIRKYGHLVEQTAEFMASFATRDEQAGRYVLKGIIPAQETLRASETINPPFELAYWHYALSIAQQWRERAGKERNPQWDELIDKLSPLADRDGLYLASEDAIDTYTNPRFTSDHPAVLGALGILPASKLVNPDTMKTTLDWIWNHWNWNETWGWDYPMTAMCAARLGDPQKAIDALLKDERTNTYLINGHNYQDDRLRAYLPGNGGLLTAIAMMCAGWDGNSIPNPGFPKDGQWDVVWEGLKPMP